MENLAMHSVITAVIVFILFDMYHSRPMNTEKELKKIKLKNPNESIKNGKSDMSAFDRILAVNKKLNKNKDLTEGDLWLNRHSISKNHKTRRNVANTKLWNSKYNATNPIPFRFSTELPVTADPYILEALEFVENETCIRFIETFQALDHLFQYDDMIIFTDEDSCWSDSVGMHGGKQNISITAECTNSSSILHELLHALGFWHTQARPDRDDYIVVNLTNVIPGNEDEFTIHEESTTVGSYDTQSIMHFGPLAYSLNGLETIIPVDSSVTLYENNWLSDEDIDQLNALYCNTTSS